nr:hypothetical protein [Tanacetum cinerariifolium]
MQDSALTWWNSHKRTIGVDAAYAMKWAGLMKLMTKVYCVRNEIQKIETELWNLTVKGNDLTTYTQRFQELILLCTRMTWWNSHKRTIGVDAAYAMKWAGLMKLMTKVYCVRNEIQKIETELWNLTVKGNDLTTYTQRFQELILLCTRMVLNEKDRVERFIGGLPDNIQGNVITANPARLQDAIRIANQLMDKKLRGYAARSAENKRRMESNPMDNHGQQLPFKRQNTIGQNVAKAYTTMSNKRKGMVPDEEDRVERFIKGLPDNIQGNQPPFKWQNTSGQNVARAYMDGSNGRKGYVGFLPYCNKCRLHHEGLCMIRCGNCKKIGHQTRDCKVTVTPNT